MYADRHTACVHACVHAYMRRALGAFRNFQVAGSLDRTDLCRHVQSGSCNRSLRPQTLEPETLAFGLKPQGTLKPKPETSIVLAPTAGVYFVRGLGVWRLRACLGL